jgi:hypothetical protein
MKDLDGDSLFSIFDRGDEEVYTDTKHNVDLSDNALLMGMVIRGVDNYFLLDKIYFNRYGEYYLSVKEKIKLKYFLRLLEYLKSVKDLSLETISYTRDEFGFNAIVYSLQSMLSLFEEKEMYEDCVVIKKYLDLFKESSLFLD